MALLKKSLIQDVIVTQQGLVDGVCGFVGGLGALTCGALAI
jgi:hypothetical protein